MTNTAAKFTWKNKPINLMKMRIEAGGVYALIRFDDKASGIWVSRDALRIQ